MLWVRMLLRLPLRLPLRLLLQGSGNSAQVCIGGLRGGSELWGLRALAVDRFGTFHTYYAYAYSFLEGHTHQSTSVGDCCLMAVSVPSFRAVCTYAPAEKGYRMRRRGKEINEEWWDDNLEVPVPRAPRTVGCARVLSAQNGVSWLELVEVR